MIKFEYNVQIFVALYLRTYDTTSTILNLHNRIRTVLYLVEPEYSINTDYAHSTVIVCFFIYVKLFVKNVKEELNTVRKEPNDDDDEAVYLAMSATKDEERLETLHEIKLLDKLIRDFLKVYSSRDP